MPLMWPLKRAHCFVARLYSNPSHARLSSKHIVAQSVASLISSINTGNCDSPVLALALPEPEPDRTGARISSAEAGIK